MGKLLFFPNVVAPLISSSQEESPFWTPHIHLAGALNDHSKVLAHIKSLTGREVLDVSTVVNQISSPEDFNKFSDKVLVLSNFETFSEDFQNLFESFLFNEHYTDETVVITTSEEVDSTHLPLSSLMLDLILQNSYESKMYSNSNDIKSFDLFFVKD